MGVNIAGATAAWALGRRKELSNTVQ